jgi:acyl-coenzyme A synthetase/AMP-(fatty) acid ligase
MVPAHWLALDRFPKTSNGKVDRPRLRQLFQSEVMHA